MTAEKDTSSLKKQFMFGPWLIVAGALALYLGTLNHWVTLSSLPIVSQITGWDWHPGYLEWRPNYILPLYTIVTEPIRLLPVHVQPMALNAFSALCAALTLGLLARSVRLLPHDRTKEQRLREPGVDSLLSVKSS